MQSARIIAVLSLCLLAPMTSAQERNTRLQQEDLIATFDTAWPTVHSGGYRPLNLKLQNRGSDATVTIRVVALPDDYAFVSPEVTKTIRLNQNATTDLCLLLPYVSQYSVGMLQFERDGKRLKSMDWEIRWGEPGEPLPSLLVVSDERPRLDIYESALGMRGSEVATTIAPVQLPEQWLAFSSVDLVAVSLETFERDLRPAQQEAVLTWVRTGGNLVIFESNHNEEGVGNVNRVLGLDRTAAAGSWRPVADYSAADRPSGSSVTNEEIAEAILQQQLARRQQLASLTHYPNRLFEDSEAADSESSRVAIRGLSFGQIAVVTDDPFAVPESLWRLILFGLDDRNTMWFKRHGMVTSTKANDFLKFINPGVQIIPLWGFITLITLFSIVIGPVNYVLLRRRNKLPQLLWTIPAAAALTSLVIFAYSFIAVGGSTKLRVRSMTLLDQRHQTAVSLTRMAAFTGRAPRDGMRFEPSTAVYPIWQQADSFRGAHFDWTNAQEITGSLHASNTRSQFLLVSPRTERGRLDIGKPANGRLTVTNGLEWDIELLLLRGPDDLMYFGRDVDAGQTAELQVAGSADLKEFAKRIDEQRLVAPAMGSPPTESYDDYMRYPGSYGYNTYNNANFATSHLERHLFWLRNEFATSGLDRYDQAYVAVLRQSPGLDLGFKTFRTTEALHVLMGFY